MLEPSKPMPSPNRSSSSTLAGRLKCCHMPGRSTNFRSTIANFSVFTNDNTSLADSRRLSDFSPDRSSAGKPGVTHSFMPICTILSENEIGSRKARKEHKWTILCDLCVLCVSSFEVLRKQFLHDDDVFPHPVLL